MPKIFDTLPEALAYWNKPDRRAGLARVHDGKMYIFDHPTHAIGHFTAQVMQRAQ